MNVENIMTQLTKTCSPSTSLADAAKLMWDGDFGFLPAVEGGKLIGVLTDRDICMGVATQGGQASGIPVKRVMSRKPISCGPKDKLDDALKTMAVHRVRRLPVVDSAGKICGVLSINDVVQELKTTRGGADAPDIKKVMTTLQSIGRHRDLPATMTS